MWIVVGGLGYAASFSILAGYRGGDVNYPTDSFIYAIFRREILGFVFNI